MNNLLLNLYVRFQLLMDGEDGQDMAEYALVVALLSFAAVASMRNLAAGIGNAFSLLSTKVGENIT